MSQKRRTPRDEKHLLIRSSSAGLPGGYEIQRHRHSWHQLIFAIKGVMTVATPRGHWVVPPQSAVWVPAESEHAIRFTGQSELRTLYLRPSFGKGTAKECSAMTVSPLLRELILRTTSLGALDERRAAEKSMAFLIREELQQLQIPPLNLPAPWSAPLQELTKRLAKDDGRPGTPALARGIGLSARTLERRFLAETGMTFFQWRLHARMLRALEQILLGEPLKVAAERAGYRGQSAFVAAFKSAFGTSPRRYASRLAA
ncbi:MAG TPA: helix-turn-helix transcriptional regulator [Myxococcales bacterium]|jgi:AraC-like DNA-binding protein/quercetin dioxygenase-like cupin family protein|nr:helix-turn-helix transcriptional regulator [Myxococcales bacterium]